MDRFHPLAVTYEGVSGWWVCDGHADTEHTLAVPCIEEPCEDRDEAVALCAIPVSYTHLKGGTMDSLV